jgi:hypothetical protein
LLGLRHMPREFEHAVGHGDCRTRQHEMILGIDIGVQGAVAVIYQSGGLVAVHDMPTLQDGPAGRRSVNAPLLASNIFKSHATAAFVESVNARPGERPTGAFAFGRAVASSKAFSPQGDDPGWQRCCAQWRPRTIRHGRISQAPRRMGMDDSGEVSGQCLIPVTDSQADAIKAVAELGKTAVEEVGQLARYIGRVLGTVPQDVVGIVIGEPLHFVRTKDCSEIR